MKDEDKTKQQPARQKPETTPFFSYYLIDPIQGLGWEITDAMESFWHWVTGAWYCNYCKRYHGRRITKYTIKPSPIKKLLVTLADRPLKDLQVCSLGRDAELQRQAKAENETVYRGPG